MRCSLYRIDPPSLIAALTTIETLNRYQETIAEEIKSLADRALVKHLRRMSTLASAAMAHGFDSLARADLPGADELLTELFAVGTWHQWELPIERIGEEDVTVDDVPRGMLAADVGRESAQLWLLDGRTLALSRSRESGDEAELPSCH